MAASKEGAEPKRSTSRTKSAPEPAATQETTATPSTSRRRGAAVAKQGESGAPDTAALVRQVKAAAKQ